MNMNIDEIRGPLAGFLAAAQDNTIQSYAALINQY